MVYDYFMKCGYCGEENRDDSLFCMACGSRITQDKNAGAGQGETIGFVLPDNAGGSREATSFWDPQGEAAADGAAAPKPSGFVFGGATPEQGDSIIETQAPAYAAPEPPSASAVREVVRTPAASVREEATPVGDQDYFMPPEADGPPQTSYKPAEVGEIPQEEPVPSTPPVHPAVDRTQAISPVPAVAGTPRKVICPECYAANTEQNRYCQECGNPLALRPARTAAPAGASTASSSAPQHTAVMSADMVQQAVAAPAHRAREASEAGTRSEKSFGAADVLALLGVMAAGIAISPIFAWKKGLSISIFTHQGAYSLSRTDLLGGPGLLPYSGAEFFTIGLVSAIAIGLAVVFLMVRVGRGPMFILAGLLLLFPIAYLLFQGILPLRQSGVNIQPALGLHGILFGNTANVGAGLSLWLITGAGFLVLVAGFLAPPRGWGRLFTFTLFLSVVVGAAFFCAASYNWNIFINQPASGTLALHTKASLSLPLAALLFN